MSKSTKDISNSMKHQGFLQIRSTACPEAEKYLAPFGILCGGTAAIRAPYEMVRTGGSERRHWTLWLIHEGTVEFEIPGKRFTAPPGTSLFMCSDTNRRCVVREGIFRHTYFSFTPRPGWEQTVTPSLYAEEIEALINLFVRFQIEKSAPAEMQHIAELLNDCLQRELKAPHLAGRIRRMIELVESSPAHKWTVDELARRLNMSVSLLYQRVKEQCGRSPGELIDEIRFQFASEMLLRTDAKLDEIAAQTGYSNAFAFSKAFTRHTGKSPREYRKER